MPKTYTIVTSAKEMKDVFIPVEQLGFDPDAEALMLPAELHEPPKGDPYWILLEFPRRWALPLDYAFVVQEHDE